MSGPLFLPGLYRKAHWLTARLYAQKFSGVSDESSSGYFDWPEKKSGTAFPY